MKTSTGVLKDMGDLTRETGGPKFAEVDQAEFDRLKRLKIPELVEYMAAREIDGVLLADDPTLRIVA